MKYMAPEIEFLELEEVDVICTSESGEIPDDETGEGNKVPTPGQNQGGIF